MDETTDPNAAPSLRQGRSPREHLKRAAAVLPMVRPVARYVPKNPAFLLGAAAVGLGFLAWRNRERIRRTAAPLIEDARVRGIALAQRLPRPRQDEIGA